VCAQYGRPAGVAFRLQVCRYSIKPPFANCCCNLLPKDSLRAALADEIEEHGPEVAFVCLSESSACGAEGLAWARACPDWTICGPSSKLEGETPPSNASEEVALGVASQVVRLDLDN
jgi:hypothetical protein